jgi:ribosomal protein S18 acetylase RimI-like enzyme
MLTRCDLRLEFIRDLPLGLRNRSLFSPRGNGLTVRPATLQDVPGIHEVHSDGGDPWADPAECAIWTNHRLLRGFTIDVAVLDARVVGHAEWEVSDEPAPYGRHLYLSMIEIHRQFRGRGIGREMVEAPAATAASRGCSAVRTIPDDGAKGFYARLGFTVSGQLTRMCTPPRPAELPEGWKNCRSIPHSVVKRLPMRFGWYQACSEFMWEHYDRPMAIAGDDLRHLRARRMDGKAFIDVECYASEKSADPASWASPDVHPAELVQAAFALSSRLPANRVSFAVDSAYGPAVAPFIGDAAVETNDIVSRSVT